MCGLNWAWVSGLFAVYGVGPNWASASKPCWAPRRILCGFVGQTWPGFLGCLLGMEWAPIEPQPSSPVGPTLDMIRGLNWTWVSGLFTGYGVGPTWGPASKPSWAPRRISWGYVG